MSVLPDVKSRHIEIILILFPSGNLLLNGIKKCVLIFKLYSSLVKNKALLLRCRLLARPIMPRLNLQRTKDKSLLTVYYRSKSNIAAHGTHAHSRTALCQSVRSSL